MSAFCDNGGYEPAWMWTITLAPRHRGVSDHELTFLFLRSWAGPFGIETGHLDVWRTMEAKAR